MLCADAVSAVSGVPINRRLQPLTHADLADYCCCSGFRFQTLGYAYTAFLRVTMSGEHGLPLPIAPYTSFLRYPGDALITLARSIINALDEHHRALFDAADKAGDEDLYEEQMNTVIDISGSVYAFDRMKWTERAKHAVPDEKWDADEYTLKGPPEVPLFTTNSYKSEWVSCFDVLPPG
jgi:hypothetical protein